MVIHSPIIEVSLGEYSITGVRQGPAPSPGSNGHTEIAFGYFSATDLPDAQAQGAPVVFTQRRGKVDLDNPVLGENSKIDFYLRGPQPAILKTEPLARSTEEVYRGREFQHFRVTYQGAVGGVTWKWVTPAGSVSIELECFPTKLDYRRDYARICEALHELSTSLTASVSGAATGSFGADARDGQQGAGEWLENVRTNIGELADSVDHLLPRLRFRVSNTLMTVPRDRMRRAKPVSRRAYASRRPSEPILAAKLVSSLDDPLNGYLKWELTQLLSQTSTISATDWFEELDDNLTEPVNELNTRCRRWLAALDGVATVRSIPNLHIRLQDPFYGKAFRALFFLKNSIDPLKELRPVALKDLPTLYEYWVFIQVAEILKTRFPTVLVGDSPMVQRAGADLVLTPGRSSRIALSDAEGNQVNCHYNRQYSGLPTTNQRPDAVIEIASRDRLLVVDAKYRIGRDTRYLRQYSLEGPLAEDINVLHRYRDAIVAPLAPHERLSRAGVIAFPSRESKKYRFHQFYRSWLAMRIGGMPLLPGATELMEEALDDFFEDVLVKDVV